VLVSFKFDPERLAKLRERAKDGKTSVTALLERGADIVLAAPAATPLAATDRREGNRRAEPRRAEDALCVRCPHARRSHWARGCMAGCACSERLFRPRTAPPT
jgi:hypothetical protein